MDLVQTNPQLTATRFQPRNSQGLNFNNKEPRLTFVLSRYFLFFLPWQITPVCVAVYFNIIDDKRKFLLRRTMNDFNDLRVKRLRFDVMKLFQSF